MTELRLQVVVLVFVTTLRNSNVWCFPAVDTTQYWSAPLQTAPTSVRAAAAAAVTDDKLQQQWPRETMRRAWPLAVVPYSVSGLSVPLRSMLRVAIDDVERHTCVDFVPHTDEAEYVLFRGVDFGCFVSAYGREKDAVTIVALGNECFGSGIGTIHALIMRALGFGFEHLRLDRDQHISVHTDRMFGHAMRDRFRPDVEPVLEHDYGSVLHLAPDAFAQDDADGPTIEPRRPLPAGVVMGQRHSLSAGDVAKIRFIYNCSSVYPM